MKEFLDKIEENLFDRAPILVLADYLEEQGEDLKARRLRIIDPEIYIEMTCEFPLFYGVRSLLRTSQEYILRDIEKILDLEDPHRDPYWAQLLPKVGQSIAHCPTCGTCEYFPTKVGELNICRIIMCAACSIQQDHLDKGGCIGDWM